MEKDFILVTQAKHQAWKVSPLVQREIGVFWLVFLTEDTAIYRLRMDMLEVGKLKKAMDEMCLFDRMELFEFASW